MSAVTDVQDAVAAQTTVTASTQTLVTQISTLLASDFAALNTAIQELKDQNPDADTAALEAAAGQIQANTQALSDAGTIMANAITANTPAATPTQAAPTGFNTIGATDPVTGAQTGTQVTQGGGTIASGVVTPNDGTGEVATSTPGIDDSSNKTVVVGAGTGGTA